MNCGMEDTLVLDYFMHEKYPNDRLKAFQEYSKYRNPDAEAICDLAMYNYIEIYFKHTQSYNISDIERY